MSIPHTFVQELLARADVVDIVGRHVQLKKSGANFMGLCPFHSEKSPSFSVSPSKQFYHCFGCGKSGDALNFLMEHTGASFVEAVQDLAQQFGMRVPEDDASPQDRARAAEQRKKQTTLTEVLEKAALAYQKHLKNSPRAASYFKGRGVTGQVAKQFGLGYAPEGWHALAGAFADYDDPLLEESGLVILGEEKDGQSHRYDRFRDRVMFPIRNVKGECIGFGGRVLGDDKPKYLNSPETPVFSKGRELYGLFEARNAIRDEGFALVTEGYMDVVALAQLGFPNAVATLGTACTPDHVHKLFRFTDAVIFSFDGDSAGRRAARKALDAALPLATDVRSVKFLFLPPEHDPDSFIREHGKEAFARFVSESVPLSQFLIDAARDGCDLQTAEGRARFASNAKPLWEVMPAGALKQQLLSEIADLVQLSNRELLEVWQHAPARGSRNSAAKPVTKDAEPPVWNEGPRPRKAKQSNRPNSRLPAARADHAARILLGNMAAFDTLTNEDLALLCGLEAPHGPLFVWLQAQYHEHGVQPWGALRAGLAELASQTYALQLMSGLEMLDNNTDIPGEQSAEAKDELRQLLNRMLVEQLKINETAAIQAAKTDPCALLRYREFQTRRMALEATGPVPQATGGV
ncbi:MAG: DNA primase [Comamonadaceae bacterium CG1_02_60_18]|nr:MAG: DNA primase [Comamonadaceae bacterium CG1_02_60_18]PIQ50851.1 MAG: DNA primase [Comamonadaceae bacterium CG12_big_fil_rev_8_21_14_0_65_59_15]